MAKSKKRGTATASKAKVQGKTADAAPTSGLTVRTLQDTVPRAFAFLTGIGTTPVVRSLLLGRGYRKADHDEGWRLARAAAEYTATSAPVADKDVTSAIATLNATDEDLVRIVRSSMRKHRDAITFVLAGVQAVDGPGAVNVVGTILDRLDALENGTERPSTRKEDKAAIATLALRGVDATERARLRALVDKVSALDETPVIDNTMPADHLEKLEALRAWFEEWTDVARAVVKRRDYLIRLGLAERHAREDEGGGGGTGGGTGTGTPTT